MALEPTKYERAHAVHTRQVVPPLELTLEQLAGYDGHDTAKPMLLAIKGVVYDVTKGKDYYGPNGGFDTGCRGAGEGRCGRWV